MLIPFLQLKLPKVAVYCATCDVLEGDGQVMEALRCFRDMQGELTQDADVGNERAKWELGEWSQWNAAGLLWTSEADFQRRCTEGLEKLADAAFDSQNYGEADRHYSTILSFNQPHHAHALIKRSNTRAMMKLWEDALMDADEVCLISAMLSMLVKYFSGDQT